MTDEERKEGRTFPVLARIRDVSLAVACAVIDEGFAHGLNTRLKGQDFPTGDSLRAYVRSKMWQPDYKPLVGPSPRHHH